MKSFSDSRFIIPLLLTLIFSGCDGDNPKKGRGERDHLVEVATVVSGDLTVQRVRTGSLKAKEEIQVKAREEGMVKELPFHEGDLVKKGDVLVRLDDELLSSQRNRAIATKKQADLDVERLKKLRKTNVVSEDELNRAITSREVAKADVALLDTRIGYTVITSPIDGIVSERMTEPGNIVEQHSHILTVIDPTALHTELQVSELIIPHIHLGDETQVTIDALGNRVFHGKVSRIFPNLDPVTRRGTIEVEIFPVPEGASPGQLCRVHLNTNAAQRQVIPFLALRRDEKGEFVYLLKEDLTVERREVNTGLRLAELVEVVSGLENGQKVITRGFLGLSPGKKVKPVKGK